MYRIGSAEDMPFMPFITVTARVYVDSSGTATEIPSILSKDGILESLLDYSLLHAINRSLSWHKKLVQAVTLFLEYTEANQFEDKPWKLFRNFAACLYTGTFDLKTGLDPSWLCWDAKSWRVAKNIINMLSEFFKFLGETSETANKLNPPTKASSYDQRIDHAAYIYKRNQAFLGHTWAFNPVVRSQSGLTRARRTPMRSSVEPPEFPDDRFEELLFKGFKIGRNYDYRGMLITLLMHGAGFRESEPFHLYIVDVAPDATNSSSASVKIHHPSDGEAPSDWRVSTEKNTPLTRAVYLAKKWGIRPRTTLVGRTHAGWKTPRLDGKSFMHAWWFDPVYGNWFLQIWQYYLQQVACIDRSHPFAFINLDREPIGEMYCIDSFLKAHEAAVRRINLTYGKGFGTTPHGHRHSYAQRLKRNGVDPVLRQYFLHHRSINSQSIYTQPTVKESLAELAKASARLRLLVNGDDLLKTYIEDLKVIFGR